MTRFFKKPFNKSFFLLMIAVWFSCKLAISSEPEQTQIIMLSKKKMHAVCGEIAPEPVSVLVIKSIVSIFFWNTVETAVRECTAPILIEIEDQRQCEQQKGHELSCRIEELKWELINLRYERDALLRQLKPLIQ